MFNDSCYFLGVHSVPMYLDLTLTPACFMNTKECAEKMNSRNTAQLAQ